MDEYYKSLQDVEEYDSDPPEHKQTVENPIKRAQ